MKKIDISGAPSRRGSGYPPPHGEPCAARLRRRLGETADLTAFGVNHPTLPPGAWSSQRHWHSHEDEFVWVVSGVVVLVTNAYSDIDMVAEPLEEGFRRKDGTPIA
ncbi:MAG: Cupin 2 conserved barrel domain protein [Caulobacteraceae bacterium]|nr:Cupin 2 conserved barrel domain protein [Caulobacteraceae bacterium]